MKKPITFSHYDVMQRGTEGWRVTTDHHELFKGQPIPLRDVSEARGLYPTRAYKFRPRYLR